LQFRGIWVYNTPVFHYILTMKRQKRNIKNPFGPIKKYFEEVIIETKKVTWPSSKKTYNLTLVVIATSVFISVTVTIVDYLFNMITFL